MTRVSGLLLGAFFLILLGGLSLAAPAVAQDDTGYTVGEDVAGTGQDTGYEDVAGTDQDTGYTDVSGTDTGYTNDGADVLGTSLARTGTNVFLLVLIGLATVGVGLGLDRWSSRLETVQA